MKLNFDWKPAAIALLAGVAGGFFWGRSTLDTETVKIPITIEYKIPSFEGNFEVATGLVPVKETEYRYIPSTGNGDLLAKYDSLQGEVAKRDAFIETIRQRVYNESFDDDFQTIFVDATTTGYLDSLAVRYKTKPQEATIDTVVEVEQKRYMYLVPNATYTMDGSLAPGADLILKNGIMLGASKDLTGDWSARVGYAIKF